LSHKREVKQDQSFTFDEKTKYVLFQDGASVQSKLQEELDEVMSV